MHCVAPPSKKREMPHNRHHLMVYANREYGNDLGEAVFMVLRSMNSVDSFIGRRMRQFRWLCGMSHDDLAEHLSVEPEQIKAYERGEARVAAAQLFQIAEAMNVPVTAFFEGMGATPGPGKTGAREDLSAREIQMLSHFQRMSDRQQDAVLSMTQTMAEQQRRAPKPVREPEVLWPERAREG